MNELNDFLRVLLQAWPGEPKSKYLPKMYFDGTEWELNTPDALAYGQTLPEAFFCFATLAQANAENTFGDGAKWNATISFLEPWASPLDLSLIPTTEIEQMIELDHQTEAAL